MSEAKQIKQKVKMPDNVYLSIGRHGRYDYESRLPLLNNSLLEGVYRGCKLVEDYGAVDVFYSSEIARASATAKMRAVGAGYPIGKILYCRELSENAPSGQVALFIDAILAEAQIYGYQHIHLVTHAPVIEKLLSVLTRVMCYMPADGCLVLTAGSWTDMLERKSEYRPAIEFYPGFSLLEEMWKAFPEEAEIQKRFADNPRVNINWCEIFTLLNKLNCLQKCRSMDEVCEIMSRTDIP